jgi:hypothetical protein
MSSAPDMKLEVVVIPVSDVERAKRFWRPARVPLECCATPSSRSHVLRDLRRRAESPASRDRDGAPPLVRAAPTARTAESPSLPA